MSTLLLKSVALISPSSKIGTYLHKVDVNLQEDEIQIQSVCAGLQGYL